MTNKKTPVIKNIVDAFKIMDMINEKEEVGVTEIAETLAIPKATIYRILKSLEAVNAVKQNNNSRYSLDYHLLNYAKGVSLNQDIISLAEPYMEETVALTGETIYLGMEYKQHLVVLNRIHGEFYQLQSTIQPVCDLYCSGLGKLFLSQWSDDDLKAYFNNLEKRTIHTITEYDAFKTVQKEIIKNNISADKEEFEYGLTCFAVPIFDESGKVIYALSISGPASRLEYKGIDFLVSSLQDCALKIQNEYLAKK